MKAEAAKSNLPGYLFVIPWDLSFVGGVNEVVRNLYREMGDQGLAAPSVLIPDWECRKLNRQCIDGRTILSLKMASPPPLDKTLPRKAATFLFGAPTTLLQLYDLLKNHQIKVVNPHYPGPYLFHLALLKKLFPQLFRLVISLHGSDVIAIENKAPGTAIVRHILRAADALTVPSRALAARLCAAVPEVSKRITCIYNGIAPEKFITTAHNGPEGTPAAYPILHVGSFEKIKGQDILLHAFKDVLKTWPDVRLLLVGRSGSFLNELEQLSADLGIVHAVSFMKDVPPERIAPLMAQSSFLALPSRYEGGIPLVVLEAGAVKKTVVASMVGGIGELITHQENGLLVPAEDPAALAKGMMTLLEKLDLREKMASSLYGTVSGSFSWGTTAKRYFELAMTAAIPEKQKGSQPGSPS